MEINMSDSTDVEKGKVLGSCSTPMDKNMKEIGWMGWNKDKESTKAWEILLKEFGKKVSFLKKRNDFMCWYNFYWFKY